ncbi:MAG: M42 family peptidase [Candidatus Korarchaeota archaeon NZ13-K]|nr:MAG: M42 family peptidase [Candidatus Korarchaeota archaeon NZ13-K]
MDDESVSFFSRLSESFGPSGFESEPLNLIKGRYSIFSDDVLRDGLGSLILKKRGSSDVPRVMAAGHVDEIGFIVVSIEDNGFLKFEALGGWASTTLPAQRVVVRTRKGDHVGVIASKPPHLMTPEERNKPIELKDLFIDVGAKNKDQVKEMGIRIGDPIAPLAPFEVLRGGKAWLGKAFDDRVGTFVVMEALRDLKERGTDHPNTYYAVATVQEEVGLRGAETAADVVNPDVFIAVDVDIAGDSPGITSAEAPAKMGEGVSIITWDRSMIPNFKLREFVVEVAEEENIPYQLSAVRGGTDAGRVHLHSKGVPSVVLGVPTRHIHSHSSILSPDDVEAAMKLLVALIKKMDSSTVRGFYEP